MNIKQFFSSKTTVGRTVRTFLQAVIGISAFFIGLLNIPGVFDYLVTNNIAAAGTLALTIAVATYVYNASEQLIKWLMSEDN